MRTMIGSPIAMTTLFNPFSDKVILEGNRTLFNVMKYRISNKTEKKI